MKIKSIYDRLLPDVKASLQQNARRFSTAKRLKYTLMSHVIWSDLTVENVRNLYTYTDISANLVRDFDSMAYGDNIITD
jgi:hypothetical protein